MEEVAYYLSMEQSPAGGLGLSHKQWVNIIKGKDTGDEGFPVSTEVVEPVMEWLHNLHKVLPANKGTETPVQDVVFEDEKVESNGPGENGGGSSRWKEISLEDMIESLPID